MDIVAIVFPRLFAARQRIAELELHCDEVEIALIAERTKVAVLESGLRREQQLFIDIQKEVEKYRALYIDKCEYIAIGERKPRFNVTQPHNEQPIRSERVTRAQIEEEQQRQAEKEFADWLDSHPEEKMKTQVS